MTTGYTKVPNHATFSMVNKWSNNYYVYKTETLTCILQLLTNILNVVLIKLNLWKITIFHCFKELKRGEREKEESSFVNKEYIPYCHVLLRTYSVFIFVNIQLKADTVRVLDFLCFKELLERVVLSHKKYMHAIQKHYISYWYN